MERRVGEHVGLGCQELQYSHTGGHPLHLRSISGDYITVREIQKVPSTLLYKDFRSAGNIVYECDYAQFLADHCESMLQQKLDSFQRIYLGGNADSTAAAARTVKLPLLLPNSTYMRRSSLSTAGHGVFGAFTGGQRIELDARRTRIRPCLG